MWRFGDTARMSTYLVALVAGPYHAVHDVHHGPDGDVPLGLFCRQSLKAYLEVDAADLFTVTRQGFEFYEDHFGTPYPFGKYDQLFVPEFNAGAMENIGAVTHRDDYLFRSRQTASAYESRANTVLHELAHMWFGDLVTMKWWDDLWLNESFAEWASHWASVGSTKYVEAWVNFAGRKNWAYRADQLPSTHPVAADMTDLETVENNFDGITYAKGASALRQLVAWVGEKEFLVGVRAYFAEHAYGNAEFADLIRALEASSGRDLTDWAALWLRTAGVNTLRPLITVDLDGRYSRFDVEQTALSAFPTLRPHRMAIGLFDSAGDRLVRRGRIELDITGALTAVPELIGTPAADVVLLNDDDLTYAKTRLDDRSLTALSSRIGDLDEPLARSMCWTALWDMTRDAQLPATQWVGAVLAGLPAETEIAAVQLLLRQASSSIESYAAPTHRAALRESWTTGLRAQLAAAAAGSDRQLALMRAVAGAANTAADLALVAAVFDGSDVLPGLEVDTDLRWSLLTSLARHGRAGLAEIDDELARDPTIAGQEHAANRTCGAARRGREGRCLGGRRRAGRRPERDATGDDPRFSRHRTRRRCWRRTWRATSRSPTRSGGPGPPRWRRRSWSDSSRAAYPSTVSSRRRSTGWRRPVPRRRRSDWCRRAVPTPNGRWPPSSATRPADTDARPAGRCLEGPGFRPMSGGACPAAHGVSRRRCPRSRARVAWR